MCWGLLFVLTQKWGPLLTCLHPAFCLEGLALMFCINGLTPLHPDSLSLSNEGRGRDWGWATYFLGSFSIGFCRVARPLYPRPQLCWLALTAPIVPPVTMTALSTCSAKGAGEGWEQSPLLLGGWGGGDQEEILHSSLSVSWNKPLPS